MDNFPGDLLLMPYWHIGIDVWEIYGLSLLHAASALCDPVVVLSVTTGEAPVPVL